MDLRRLAFLVRVIDAGSITRAAESLRIAQPALSQHLLLLERYYGAPLLLRSKRGVTPTPAGRNSQPYQSRRVCAGLRGFIGCWAIEGKAALLKAMTGAPHTTP